MRREQSGTFLSAVFVDYDNIYLSLRRKSEEAAKRFAKDAASWLKQIETGALITPTNGLTLPGQRRIVMNRCYGNPVPRRNTSDNSTDMSSFPFVRHHFLRAGFEVVDCPPLTAQLKNSSDIRMVMDLRDYLDHDTRFDEFVILSGDADFTPVLHRLRAHARRTVIYATDYTAAPYTAISDGEVREADLIALLIDGRSTATDTIETAATQQIAQPQPAPSLDATRRAILDEVSAAVRAAQTPVPLEVLADRAVRAIGHDRTIGTAWAGAGGFRELLAQGLPSGLRLSGEPPYVVIDTRRHLPPSQTAPAPRLQAQSTPPPLDMGEPRADRAPARPQRSIAAEPHSSSVQSSSVQSSSLQAQAMQASLQDFAEPMAPPPAQASAHAAAQTAMPQPPFRRQAEPAMAPATSMVRAEVRAEPALQAAPAPVATAGIQQSIARIHEACKAPPLAPPEYRMLFEIIAQEITENGLIGAQTIQNIAQRAQERGIDVRRDDVRFVLEVVSETDPWFEQGASATLFAGRFRNFVVARCRAQGLALSADELDLIEAWFAGSPQPVAPVRQAPPAPTFAAPPPRAAAIQQQADPSFWSGLEEGRKHVAETRALAAGSQTEAGEIAGEDFPRIVRTRIRG